MSKPTGAQLVLSYARTQNLFAWYVSALIPLSLLVGDPDIAGAGILFGTALSLAGLLNTLSMLLYRRSSAATGVRTPISDRRVALLALGTGIFGALFALCSLFVFRRTFEQDLMTVILLFYTSLFFVTLLHRYLDQRAFTASAAPRTVA